MAGVRQLSHVLSATDPLAAATTSGNGRTAYSTVHFSVNPQSLGSAYVSTVDRAVAPARAAGISVSYGGQLGAAAQPKSKDARSEEIGIAAALIVLLVGFGIVYAAGLPIISALGGAFAGLGLLGMLAAATTFATVSPTLAIMMGLGVGIDYALFLTTRHRQLVMDGAEPADSATPPHARSCGCGSIPPTRAATTSPSPNPDRRDLKDRARWSQTTPMFHWCRYNSTHVPWVLLYPGAEELAGVSAEDGETDKAGDTDGFG